MNLLLKVKKVILKEHLIEEGEKVLVGLSGGLDSTTLLYLLVKLKDEMAFDLGVAHVNHLLRGVESERDERFVRELAERLRLPFYLKRVETKIYAKKKGLSIQQAARDLRYAFLDEIAEKEGYEKIAIAHNLDDQVETFFLRIIKGTGIKGLLSIPIKRGKIIRPLLFVKRKELEEYAKEKGIEFVEDSSNVKSCYQRNFIRHNLIPLMERLNPSFKEKVIFLLSDLTLINEIFEEKTEEAMKFIKEKNGKYFLPVRIFLEMDREVRFRVLSKIISSFLDKEFVLTRRKAEIIERMAKSKRPNLNHTLKEGLYVKRIYNDLILTKEKEPLVESKEYPVSIGKNVIPSFNLEISIELIEEKPTELPSDKYIALFDAEKIDNLKVRTFREGDRFFPLGLKSPVKIKDFFISLKIPREERRRIPFLLSGNDIIWIIGFRIDDRYKITSSTKRILRAYAKSL